MSSIRGPGPLGPLEFSRALLASTWWRSSHFQLVVGMQGGCGQCEVSQQWSFILFAWLCCTFWSAHRNPGQLCFTRRGTGKSLMRPNITGHSSLWCPRWTSTTGTPRTYPWAQLMRRWSSLSQATPSLGCCHATALWRI